MIGRTPVEAILDAYLDEALAMGALGRDRLGVAFSSEAEAAAGKSGAKSLSESWLDAFAELACQQSEVRVIQASVPGEAPLPGAHGVIEPRVLAEQLQGERRAPEAGTKAMGGLDKRWAGATQL